MKANTGFTLIELIIVIVILGILSVVAAPRFIDISSDAKSAALSGVFANIKSASTLYQMKHIIRSQNSNELGYVSEDGVTFWNGMVYPGDWENGGSLDGVPEIAEAAQLNVDEWLMLHTRQLISGAPQDLYIGFPVDGVASSVSHNNRTIDVTPITDTNCYLRYRIFYPGGPVQDPEFFLETSGC